MIKTIRVIRYHFDRLCFKILVKLLEDLVEHGSFLLSHGFKALVADCLDLVFLLHEILYLLLGDLKMVFTYL